MADWEVAAVQADDPSSDALPSGQARQVADAVAPTTREKLPAGHGEHTAAPPMTPKVPTPQLEHAEAPAPE